MRFHGLYVLKKGGVPIYYKTFSDDLKSDFTLLSSFFTAILDFSKAVVKKDLQVLEIGDMRFFFDRDEEMGLTFVLVTGVSASLMLMKDRLVLIKSNFFSFFDPSACTETDAILECEDLDNRLDAVCSLKDDYASTCIEPVRAIFEEEIARGEVFAAAMYSMSGSIYFSTLPAEYMHTAMKELEIRAKSETQIDGTSPQGKNTMPKVIWQSGNELLFSQAVYMRIFSAPVYVTLLFNASETNLGMADFALEEIVKKLGELS